MHNSIPCKHMRATTVPLAAEMLKFQWLTSVSGAAFAEVRILSGVPLKTAKFQRLSEF